MAEPATNSPQIVISYHADDAKWRNRLITHLDLAVEKFGVFDDSIGPGRDLSDPFIFAVTRAKVLVLLMSPKYMASSWLKSEEGLDLMEGLLVGGVAVLTVILEDLDHQDFTLLRTCKLTPFTRTPLVDRPIEEQNVVLARLAREALEILEHGAAEPESRLTADEPTIADLEAFEKSGEVNDALERARKLAGAASHAVTTPALLFALAEGGRGEKEHFGTSQFLWDELTARGEALYTKLLVEEFPPLVSLGERAGRNIDSIPRKAHLVSPNVIKVFKQAEMIARPTGPHPFPETRTIEARHLLGALLVDNPNDDPTGAQRRLATLVGDVAALRQRFYNFIVASSPNDNLPGWRSLLTRELSEPALPKEQDSERTAPLQQPTVAGFMADDWTGRDLLGIERDVNAFASLVAAYKVEPPLSIGLFGDWGSGKSHFMRQMRKRVELLSQKARESGKPQNELGYYKNIVQIEFNAWHYIEGNLWASLVDHIFANLKFSEKEPRKYADERRDELMQKLGVTEEIQDRINSKVQECEDELRTLNERKEQAEAELQQASTQLKGFREEVKANLKTLSVAVTFSAEEKELLSRLDIQTGSAITAADVHKHYLELKSGWNAVKAKWKLFRTDKRVVRRYLLSAVLVAILIGVPTLLSLGVLPRLPTIVVSILGLAATLLAAAKPAWEQFQTSLKALEKHDQEVERERQKRITELENEVSALTKEVVAAKLEGETVGKEIAKLKADIENTSSSRILAEFIEDRAGASDYRRHLGLLALIRRDFEKLRDLFEQQRKEENEGTEVDDKKKINRIVLYIDDLDRCPPDRVVQVLQAIHLLLAFPLFVVVVGVDSRWITRSLQQSYEWLREVDEEASNGEKTAADEREDNRGRKAGATPHDYLEKIFQIPFWLKCMNAIACAEFLDGLTKEATDNGLPKVEQKDEQQAGTLERTEPIMEEVAVAETPAPTPVPSVDESVTLKIDDAIHGLSTETKLKVASVATPTGQDDTQDKIDLAPRSLTFTTFEVDYMKKLVPLIGRSPRAVKRFLNCYRLIKVGFTPTQFDSFVGEKGESQRYKATMVLLGMITGAPIVSSYVMDQLWESKTLSFKAFVDAMTGNAEIKQQADGERLISFFKSHDFGTSSDLLFQEMVNYAPRVSRFSFGVNWDDTRQ